MNKRDHFDFPQPFQTLTPYNVSAHSAIAAGIVSEGLMQSKGWGMNKREAWGNSVNYRGTGRKAVAWMGEG